MEIESFAFGTPPPSPDSDLELQSDSGWTEQILHATTRPSIEKLEQLSDHGQSEVYLTDSSASTSPLGLDVQPLADHSFSPHYESYQNYENNSIYHQKQNAVKITCGGTYPTSPQNKTDRIKSHHQNINHQNISHQSISHQSISHQNTESSGVGSLPAGFALDYQSIQGWDSQGKPFLARVPMLLPPLVNRQQDMTVVSFLFHRRSAEEQPDDWTTLPDVHTQSDDQQLSYMDANPKRAYVKARQRLRAAEIAQQKPKKTRKETRPSKPDIDHPDIEYYNTQSNWKKYSTISRKSLSGGR